MSSIRRFAAINTKVRVLKGQMLTQDDFKNLLSKKSVDEVVTYLKEHTHYNKILADKDVAEIHRRDLEMLLKKYVIIQYEKLIHYFTEEYRKLFRIMFIRYEIEDIKLYLRAVARNESLDAVRKLVVYSGIYSTVNHEVLVHSKTIEDFVNNLKETIYYDVLKPFTNESGTKLLFYVEMSLDKLYFKMLYNQSEKLDRKDEEAFKILLGKNIDLFNLEWIYRGLKFFKLSPEELINYTIMNGYSLKYNTIKELCYSKNENELINRMIDTRYGFLFDNAYTLDLFMERRIERYLYFQFVDYYHKGKMDIITAIVYMHLLEYEMRDIISITEAIRYGLNENEISKYLIRRIKGSDE
ncbi:V-type ATPase subunit [Brassicibacter mesophilus]|uniref:V-type ATPase subunit n=1 Tax=Brassicibacter mesophilus TaxID=745119 RepID=UPI003D2607F0